MSVQAITLAYAIKGLRSSEKFLLVTLANYADQDMKCWPSQGTLAADTGISRRHMVTLFAALEAKGLIRREVRARRKDGSRISDMIHLQLGEASSLRRVIHSELSSPSLVKPVHLGDELSSHEPKRTSKEPSGRAALSQAGSGAPAPEERAEVAVLMRDLAKHLRASRKAH